LVPALFTPAVAPRNDAVGVSGQVTGSRQRVDAGMSGQTSGSRQWWTAVELLDLAEAPDPGAGAWKWPADPPHAVSRPFEAPRTRYAAGHRGIDIATVLGIPVYAPAPGVVAFAGVVVDRPLLSIAHPGDLVSSLEPVQPAVTAGERVSAGQVVGITASGGHCASACLHFGVRLHGQYVSPMLMLASVPRAVLLPMDDG
jgi:murein DD-endopeptidase MepM/ murein hydrolase activator NlpD